MDVDRNHTVFIVTAIVYIVSTYAFFILAAFFYPDRIASNRIESVRIDLDRFDLVRR